MPELSYREAVRDALSTAMREDDDVFVMGEDIAEMGGSMGVTHGMLEEFGKERVRNTPISEMALAGAAIGAALQGMRPIAEIMYEDFMTLAAEQVVNQAAKLRYTSGGQLTVPVVFRTQGGAGWSPGAQHAWGHPRHAQLGRVAAVTCGRSAMAARRHPTGKHCRHAVGAVGNVATRGAALAGVGAGHDHLVS